jgi:predicted nuclease of predicted toxin-antitoxin system
MKFLVDAQLPRRMAGWLITAGHDAKHTLDLPDKNLTTDNQLCEISELEGRIVVTKDADFVDSHLLTGRPDRLLLISTGNIENSDLANLMTRLLPDVLREFTGNHFIELGRYGITVRG